MLDTGEPGPWPIPRSTLAPGGKSGTRLGPHAAARPAGKTLVKHLQGLAGSAEAGAGGALSLGSGGTVRLCRHGSALGMGTAPHLPTPQCFLAPGAS